MRFDPERGNGEVRSSSAALAIKWKKKLDLRRSMESITAPTNELGLKIIKDDAALSSQTYRHPCLYSIKNFWCQS